jgi:hypothetical protein
MTTLQQKEQLNYLRLHLKHFVSDKKKVSETKNCVKITKKDGGVYIYKDILGSKIRLSKRELKKEILVKYDCRLQVKYNEWYLIVPCDINNINNINNENNTNYKKNDLCALDPGVRSFQTIYSE